MSVLCILVKIQKEELRCSEHSGKCLNQGHNFFLEEVLARFLAQPNISRKELQHRSTCLTPCGSVEFRFRKQKLDACPSCIHAFTSHLPARED